MSTNQSTIRIYTDFDPELLPAWKRLYEKGANYNLSDEWCCLWFKYFGKRRKLHIITLWEGHELKALAPFYLRRNRLTLIGTKPDLYDEFDILYDEKRHLDGLFDYIEENRFELLMKHVSSGSEFGKYAIQRFSRKRIPMVSHVTETKPALRGEFAPSKKVRDDIKRCRNNASRNFEEELKFTYDVERRERFIDEFIRMHKKRWEGGLLEKKVNVDNFIKDLFLNSGIVVMSRLAFPRTDRTVAYHFGYRDSRSAIWSSLPAYDTDYNAISPGKILLYELIQESFSNGIAKFDFGRGSEPYKNWFANEQEILFHIKTYNTMTIVKIRNLVDKILKLVFG
jgi:CelD/BcsL family acetyltransferase involved in cellulose biosynthesis